MSLVVDGREGYQDHVTSGEKGRLRRLVERFFGKTAVLTEQDTFTSGTDVPESNIVSSTPFYKDLGRAARVKELLHERARAQEDVETGALDLAEQLQTKLRQYGRSDQDPQSDRSVLVQDSTAFEKDQADNPATSCTVELICADGDTPTVIGILTTKDGLTMTFEITTEVQINPSTKQESRRLTHFEFTEQSNADDGKGKVTDPVQISAVYDLSTAHQMPKSAFDELAKGLEQIKIHFVGYLDATTNNAPARIKSEHPIRKQAVQHQLSDAA